MRKFGDGSGILREASASFLHRPGSVPNSPAEDGKGQRLSGEEEVKGQPVKVSIGPEAPALVVRKESDARVIVTVSDTGEYEAKPWEEPPLPKPQSDRKTSYVRLPGKVLTNEEEEDLQVEKEHRAKELVNYIQDKWSVQIEHKPSLVEVNYRTVEMLMHKQPPNHWLLKRAREKIAENTGFFSNVAKPYEFLGVPEMDNDMVVLKNLPDSLKISPDEWIEVQLRREKEKERQKARLPRLKHLKSKKTVYTRGRIKRGAGGISYAERLIANGERIQREIRGTTTLTKLLEKWTDTMEDETANRGGTAFGQVKRSKTMKQVAVMPDLTGAGGAGFEKDDLGRVVVQVDEKAYNEFLAMEKMITAIYYLIKSMINVRMSQLKSQNRIPLSAVLELRSRSPTARKKRKSVPLDLLDKFSKNSGFYSALTRGFTGESKKKGSSDLNEKDKQTAEFERKLKNLGATTLQFQGSRRNVPPQPFNPVPIEEIYPVSETGSAEDVKTAVERVKQITDSECYLDDRPFELRSANLRKERPMAQAERIRRHAERFRAMFLHRLKPAERIWWDVRVRDYSKRFEAELGANDPEPLHPLKSVESMKSTTSIPHSDKFPDPDDVPTPKLPGPPSLEQLSSEEQSRLNLLTIVPEAAYAEPPRSAVRKLYECAGVKTLDKDLFDIMMSIKRPFRNLEKSLRVSVTTKLEKFEWDMSKRYKAKIQADCSSPIYEKAIGNMRLLSKLAARKEMEEMELNIGEDEDMSQKQPAPWFRDLVDLCDEIGALRHHGCSRIVHKLVRFADVNSNSKPFMLKRFCLLVVSLPANEIAAPHFQKAISFLLEKLFGAPPELMVDWLLYRGFRPLF